MCCTRFVHYDCALVPGHLNLRVVDSSWCNEDIVKISNCAFQCDYCYYYYYYYSYYDDDDGDVRDDDGDY